MRHNMKQPVLCELCYQNFARWNPDRPDSCSVKKIMMGDGKIYKRSTYHFSEQNGRCHDCGIKHGGYHHSGCGVDRCPKCGKQLIGCDCI